MADTRKRGFSSMDKAKQREIASKGGKAAHQKGTAHEFTPEEARDAGRKGGAASRARRAAIRAEQQNPSESGQDRSSAGGYEQEHSAEQRPPE